jgi:putative Flp pilus-assembly TadE/G-like protein
VRKYGAALLRAADKQCDHAFRRRHALTRRRQRAQTFVLAALAMVAMIGAISMVIDVGVYFVIQRELQNAADAAVLDAVWYEPACPSRWVVAGCQANNNPSPALECTVPPNNSPPGNPVPCTAAVNEVEANWNVALSLCAGPQQSATGSIQIVAGPGLPPAGSIVSPSVSPYQVTVSCDAPHWFARVLPGVKPSMRISASSAAALGWLDPNTGQLRGDPRPGTNPPLVARLLLTQVNP